MLPRLLATVLLVAGFAAAQDWPRFRGPNGSGVSDTSGLPSEFGPSKNLRWKTAVPFSRSSPVIAGDRIYLTAAEGDQLITLCLDRSSGRVRWRRQITRPRVMPIYKLNDPASPTPVTDGRNVYAFFAEMGLVSFTSDGVERWRLPLGPFDTFYGVSTSPILSGATLLMLCDTRSKGFLIAVDSASGRVRWRVERSLTRMEGYSTPVIYTPAGEPAQVIVLGGKRLDAYAVATGERIWWLRGLGHLPVATPVFTKNAVVVTTYGSDALEGPAFEEFLKSDANGDGRLAREEMKDFDEFGHIDTNSDGFIDRQEWDFLRNAGLGEYGLLAVPLGGRGEFTSKAILWREKKSYALVPSSLLYQDVLYVIKSGGIITSLDSATGRQFKTDRAKDALGEYYASPVAADGKVVFVSEAGKVVVVKAGPQWEVLAVNDLGEESYATPAITAGQLFIRTRNALYCFGK